MADVGDVSSTSEREVLVDVAPEEEHVNEVSAVVDRVVTMVEQQQKSGNVHEDIAVRQDDSEMAQGPSGPQHANAADVEVVDIGTASGSSSSSSGSSSSSSSDSSSSDSSSESDAKEGASENKTTPPMEPIAMVDTEVAVSDVKHTGDASADRSPEDSGLSAAEQWFDESELEAQGMEMAAAEASHTDYGDDDDDIFLTPLPTSPKKAPSSSSATKRPRHESESDADSVIDVTATHFLTTSSSSGDEADDIGKHERFANASNASNGRKRKRKRVPTRAPKYTSVPPEYAVFEAISPDDNEFPVLRGVYAWKNAHRVMFKGHWGFKEKDFHSQHEGAVSKFEYTSAHVHDPPAPRHRKGCHVRPYSGSYGGFFNLRQFSGRNVRVKEDEIEFHFLKLEPDNGGLQAEEKSEDRAMEDSDDDEEDEDNGTTTKYEVLGRGKNRFGRFLVHGYFNASNGRMTVRRRYLE